MVFGMRNWEGKGVSRALLYLEYLNTRNTFTKKLNDKEEKDNRLKLVVLHDIGKE